MKGVGLKLSCKQVFCHDFKLDDLNRLESGFLLALIPFSIKKLKKRVEATSRALDFKINDLKGRNTIELAIFDCGLTFGPCLFM